MSPGDGVNVSPPPEHLEPISATDVARAGSKRWCFAQPLPGADEFRKPARLYTEWILNYPDKSLKVHALLGRISI